MARAALFMIATFAALIPVIAVFLAVAMTVCVGGLILAQLAPRQHRDQHKANGKANYQDARQLARAGAR